MYEIFTPLDIKLFNPIQVLCRWALSVKKNYRPVKYHNWRHALNVCQTMFTMLKTGKMDRFTDDLEVFGLLVACLCHDLDHRGTNNSYQTKVSQYRHPSSFISLINQTGFCFLKSFILMLKVLMFVVAG